MYQTVELDSNLDLFIPSSMLIPLSHSDFSHDLMAIGSNKK